MAYARGKYAKAISDRSGMAFPYNEMVKEWNGSLVHKSEYEAKHPQIRRKHITADPIALANAKTQKFQQPTQPFINDSTTDQTKADSGGGGQVVVNLTLPGDFAFRTEGSISQTSTDANPQYGSMVPEDGSAENRKRELNAEVGKVTVDALVITQTFAVTVVGGNPSNHPYHNVGSTNKFAIDGSTATADVTLTFEEGKTYRFDQSDSSNDGHPLRISETPNGTHGGGSEYTVGVVTNGVAGQSGAYTQITVAVGAPTLYYYCTNHSAMGWTINTEA
jgi:hypothetical protein